MDDVVRFRVSPPASKKNRRIIKTTGKHPLSLPSKEARDSEQEIRNAFTAATKRLDVIWPDQDIAIDVTFFVKENVYEIAVQALGPKPKGKTGRRRDLHGALETICDALNEIAYTDDRQVAFIKMRRIYS